MILFLTIFFFFFFFFLPLLLFGRIKDDERRTSANAFFFLFLFLLFFSFSFSSFFFFFCLCVCCCCRKISGKKRTSSLSTRQKRVYNRNQFFLFSYMRMYMFFYKLIKILKDYQIPFFSSE